MVEYDAGPVFCPLSFLGMYCAVLVVRERCISPLVEMVVVVRCVVLVVLVVLVVSVSVVVPGGGGDGG